MNEHTFSDYGNMLVIYGEAHCIGRVARRLYIERYPNRPAPSHKVFARLLQRLKNTGTLRINRINCGVQRNRRTIRFEEQVLQRVAQKPSTSTRSIARALGVNHVFGKFYESNYFTPIMNKGYSI